jgi:hypothetical protein
MHEKASSTRPAVIWRVPTAEEYVGSDGTSTRIEHLGFKRELPVLYFIRAANILELDTLSLTRVPLRMSSEHLGFGHLS